VKKILSFVITLLLILSAALFTASAADEEYDCGNHVLQTDSHRHWCINDGCTYNVRHSGVNDCICGYNHRCSDANGGHEFRSVNDDVHNCARDCGFLNSQNHAGHNCSERGEHWQHMNCSLCDFQHSEGPGCGTCEECLIPCGICGCLVCGECGDCEKCNLPEVPPDEPASDPVTPEIPDEADSAPPPSTPAVEAGTSGGGSGGSNMLTIILAVFTAVVFAAAFAGSSKVKKANS
jgi:hypothetical protein